jgi:hypothetical protein
MRLPTHILTLSALLFSIALSGQADLRERYVMAVSFSNVSAVNASTHTATLNFQADQLGAGYLPGDIEVGYRLLTSTKRQYEVASIASTSFSSATVTLTEIGGTTLGPNGIAAIYEYSGGTELIPLLPTNATGITAAMAAIIHTHNTEVLAGIGGGSSTVETSGDITGDGSVESPINYVRPVPTWAELTGLPPGFADDTDDVDDADNIIGNEFQDIVYDVNTGDLTLTNSGVTVTLASAFYQQAKRSSGDLDAYVSFTGNNTISLSGSASTGYTLAMTNIGEKIVVTGNSTTTNASGELILIVEDARPYPAPYNYQIYDGANNQKVDVHLTGTVASQVVNESTNQLTLQIPNMNGFPNGFRLVLN